MIHTAYVSFADALFTPHLYPFFFLLYSDHRDLHSFPTRRSSDLADGMAAPFHYYFRRHDPVMHGVIRSEEHTSELQSRQYLVCRLLLEKKKKSEKHQNQQR